MARLHLGLILPNYGKQLTAKRLVSAALTAEEAGFDSGFVTDHMVVPEEHSAIYGTITEPLSSLGYLAARTSRLELGVSALVVPQRNPLVVLKQLTTLDLLSGGRIVTAVAAGWMEGVCPPRRRFRATRTVARRVARPRAQRVRADAGTGVVQGHLLLGRRLVLAGARAPRRSRAMGRRCVEGDASACGEDGRLASGSPPARGAAAAG